MGHSRLISNAIVRAMILMLGASTPVGSRGEALEPSPTVEETRDTLSFDVAIRDDLRFMDQTALALCRENDMPVVLFDMSEPGNVARVVAGEPVGTYISNEKM